MDLSGMSVEGVSSHSAKPWMLRLCSILGVDETVRKRLGYHRVKSDSSLACYSRDMLTSPVLKLACAIQLVSSKRFDPDQDPAKRWLDEKEAIPTKGDKVDHDDSSGETESESEVQSDGMDESVAATTMDQAESLTEATVVVDDRLYQNKSGKVHRGRAGWMMKLGCRRDISSNYTRLAVGEDTLDGLGLCDTCFNSSPGRKLLKRLSSVCLEQDPKELGDKDLKEGAAESLEPVKLDLVDCEFDA